MYSAILFVVCLHSRISFSAAVYPTNWMNGLNAGPLQQPNPLPVFNNAANQFISSYNKAFNSVSNGFNAGIQLSNQAMNNMRAHQNNLQHAANPIAGNPQLNVPAGSGQGFNNIGGIQDRRQLKQTAHNAVTQAQNLQMQQQVTRYGIQNGIQSQQRSHQNFNPAQNPLSSATNPMRNILQRNFQMSNRFIPQPGLNQPLSNQTLTRTVKSPQLPYPVDQNQIAQRLAISTAQRAINTQLSKSHLQGSTMEFNKEYGFINPLEFLRKSVSTLNLSNEQRSVFDRVYNILKNAMLTFNQEFTKGYGTAFQGVVNKNNALSSGLNQLSVIQMVNNQLSYFSKILNSIFMGIRSHIIENIKGIMQVFKLNCDDLQGSNKPDLSIPSASIAVPSLARINNTMVIGNQGNSSALSRQPTRNATQITNGTFIGISETISKNVLSKSAHLIDDGSIFKAYLGKINSTQDTISKWDAIIKDKGEDGTLNLTSFAKLDPFCNCNDIVSCNCCITLNMTLISKQVCLEATVPKATNGTKLSIIFDKTRQGMTQIKGLDEKVAFDLDLAIGELEITKRPGSNNTAEEFCGIASLDTLGLRYPSLPLGCFRVSNDSISLIDDFK